MLGYGSMLALLFRELLYASSVVVTATFFRSRANTEVFMEALLGMEGSANLTGETLPIQIAMVLEQVCDAIVVRLSRVFVLRRKGFRFLVEGLDWARSWPMGCGPSPA